MAKLVLIPPWATTCPSFGILLLWTVLQHPRQLSGLLRPSLPLNTFSIFPVDYSTQMMTTHLPLQRHTLQKICISPRILTKLFGRLLLYDLLEKRDCSFFLMVGRLLGRTSRNTLKVWAWYRLYVHVLIVFSTPAFQIFGIASLKRI